MKQKGMVYQSCIRSAMSYGSETWCLRENEMAILRRTERAMVRAMCGAKLMENVISDSQACELGRNLYFYGTGTEESGYDWCKA